MTTQPMNDPNEPRPMTVVTSGGGVQSTPGDSKKRTEDEHRTIRLLMFEVYEAASPDFPLFVTSDGAAARDAADQPGDRVVKRYWVREGLDAHGVVTS